MKCPFCNSEELSVLETRESQDNRTRRRKECANCSRRFTTYEYIETIEMMVKKKNGTLQKFDSEKIVKGLQNACEKRPINFEDMKNMAEEVRLILMQEGKEVVDSSRIGLIIMEKLKKKDKVAYIRFASVYFSFEDPKDFLDMIRR
jgi:transcriptional repressor NrdR